jgi:hypothetical protein
MPGSPFLATLMETPLPHDVPHYLFFGFGGGGGSRFVPARTTAS